MTRSKAFLLLCCVLVATSHVIAEKAPGGNSAGSAEDSTSFTDRLAFGGDDFPRFRIHGFFSQSYINTSANNYFGDSTSGSWDFREVGLGIRAQITPDLSLSGVGLARWAGETDKGKVRLDHALFDYTLFRSGTERVSVSAGRMKLPIGLYNETRDVAETRPSILLPQSIYFDNARNYLINGDGVVAAWEQWGDDTYTRVSGHFKRTRGIDNIETEAYFLGIDWPGALGTNYAKGLKVLHSRNGGKTIFSLYAAKQPIKYLRGNDVDPLRAGKIDVDVVWLSAHQEFGVLGLTGELFLPRLKYRDFGPLIPNQNLYPLGYYGQLTYRHDAKWEGFARYDVSYVNKHDKAGTNNALITGRPAHAFFAYDHTIGARHHFTSKASLSLEHHWIKGTGWLPTLDNPIAANTQENWRLFAVQFSYAF